MRSTPPGPFGPLPSSGAVGSSFFPENTQIEFACAVGDPKVRSFGPEDWPPLSAFRKCTGSERRRLTSPFAQLAVEGLSTPLQGKRSQHSTTESE